MTDHDLFPSDITPEEIAAGFSVQEIDNPSGHYAFSPPTIQAVVFPLEPSDRIVKMWNPVHNHVEYKRQRYGTWAWDKTGQPEWLPFGDTTDYDPNDAILKARAGVQDDSMAKITPHVPPGGDSKNDQTAEQPPERDK
jgi:hypothetical protein